jgi:transcriptional regulator with XRE-family HTH domain
MNPFGTYIRTRREALNASRKGFSLRKVSHAAGIQPSYLSKIERGQEAPPGEEAIKRLALALEEDPDMLLALAGKVSTDLQEIIRKRPQLFSQLIREMKSMPDHALLRITREVRDGEW